ncbi:hypothetical protein KX928_21980 [Roseobacter sp. YSTF-M11]|uniref:Uncharacterized protein n=1 Tax=Roseobacter insulae TaxID=2859783 RepID=A0A9X1G0U6_9RHOB|nr:hypothetical protein [Roseobacter insulae]MBW4710468.1 hypothetical protein [Roseobacter insulae]
MRTLACSDLDHRRHRIYEACMLRQRFTSAASLLLVLIATLAMTTSAFGHRFSKDDTSDALRAYLSMGGTVAELCGDPDLGHQTSQICEACIIAATALVPDRIVTPVFAPAPSGAGRCSPATALPEAGRLEWSHPTRAPPVS